MGFVVINLLVLLLAAVTTAAVDSFFDSRPFALSLDGEYDILNKLLHSRKDHYLTPK